MIRDIVDIRMLESGSLCVDLHDDEPTRERVRPLFISETDFRDFDKFRHAIEGAGFEYVTAEGFQSCIDLKALQEAWRDWIGKMDQQSGA